MNVESYKKMKEWLESGTPTQKQHAQFRLSQPDAIDFDLKDSAALQNTKKDHASPRNGVKFQYPPILEQARNAVVAAGKAVTSGFAHVSKEEQERRLEICYTCEFWDSSQGRCSKCGCFGAFKTWLATQKCPVDKW